MPTHRDPLAQLGLLQEPVTNRCDSALLLSDELGGYQAIITRGSAVLFAGCWVLTAQLRQRVPVLSETTSPFFPAFMLWGPIVALVLVPNFLRGGSPDLSISGVLFPAPRDHQCGVPILEADALATTTWESGAELTEGQRDALLVDGASLHSLKERNRERARARRADAKAARRDRIRAWAEQELAAHPLR